MEKSNGVPPIFICQQYRATWFKFMAYVQAVFKKSFKYREIGNKRIGN